MEWDRAGADHPCRATVSRVFGSWNAAIQAAGFQPRGPGQSRLDRRRFRHVTTGELLDVPERPPKIVPSSEFHGWR